MEIIINEDGKLEVDVPVNYKMTGTIPMVFDSIEDMQTKLNDIYFVDDMPLADDPSWVIGSYVVEHDYLKEMIEKFQEIQNENV